MKPLRVLDLFSGIGGFSLGLERAGMETVAFVEIDPACRKVLQKHWPNVPVFSDIKTTTKESLNESGITSIDVIAGGFPCQDISTAHGEGKGLAGAKSGLWFEYARLIGEIQPKYVVIENVANLAANGLKTIIENLTDLGYSAAWGVISADLCGAPHERERLWIVAWRDWTPVRLADDCRPCDGCGEPVCENCSEHYAEYPCPGPHSEDDGWRIQEETFGLVAYPDLQRREEQRWGGAVSPEHFSTQLYSWWGAEPDVVRVVTGISYELDLIGAVLNGEGDIEETEPTRSIVVGRLLRAVWQHKGLAEASPRLYLQRLRDSVPEMPHRATCGRWLMGRRAEEDEGLRNMWAAFYAQPLEKAQDLQRALLERLGQVKRPKEVASRVDRIKQLGNTVIPFIPEMIGMEIMKRESASTPH